MHAVHFIPMYAAHQRGFGVGGILRRLSRHAMPILKNIGKRALRVGIDAIKDASTNDISLKQAFKKRAKQELSSLLPINRGQQGSGRKRKAIDYGFKRISTKKKRKKLNKRQITL